MTTQRVLKLAGLLVAVLALALLTVNRSAFSLTSPSTSAVQGQSFSVTSGDPLTQTNVHPADILGLAAPVQQVRRIGLHRLLGRLEIAINRVYLHLDLVLLRRPHGHVDPE